MAFDLHIIDKESIDLFVTSTYDSDKQVTWKKKVFTKEEIKSRLHVSLKDDGETFSVGLSCRYTFKRGERGKYMKFYACIESLDTIMQTTLVFVEDRCNTDVRIEDVECIEPISLEATVKQKVKLKISKYSIDESKVSSSVKEDVKWMVKVGQKNDERLVIDDIVMMGNQLEFLIPEEWENETVKLMPYLNLYSPNISVGLTCAVGTKNYVVIPSTGKVKTDYSREVQMERYRINRRSSSELTILKLNGEFAMEEVTHYTIRQIVLDYNSSYSTIGFPDYYYETCAERMVYQARFKFNENVRKKLFREKLNKTIPEEGYNYLTKYLPVVMGLEFVCELINGDKGFSNGEGAPLFHIYENVVRKNDDTGIDKLMHFLYSAKWTLVGNAAISRWLGYAKEFFNDEMMSWFGDDIGWDDLDVEANKRGIRFGENLLKSIKQ